MSEKEGKFRFIYRMNDGSIVCDDQNITIITLATKENTMTIDYTELCAIEDVIRMAMRCHSARPQSLNVGDGTMKASPLAGSQVK